MAADQIHVIVRSSLDLAVRRQLVDGNVAHATNARHKRQTRTVPRSWTAAELASFLASPPTPGKTSTGSPSAKPQVSEPGSS